LMQTRTINSAASQIGFATEDTRATYRVYQYSVNGSEKNFTFGNALNGTVSYGQWSGTCLGNSPVIVIGSPVLSDNVTGISDSKFFFQVKVYPNPVKKGKLTIETTDECIRKIELYNSLGQQVYHSDPLDVKKTTIPFDGLNRGLFLLKVKTDKGEMSKQVIY